MRQDGSRVGLLGDGRSEAEPLLVGDQPVGGQDRQAERQEGQHQDLEREEGRPKPPAPAAFREPLDADGARGEESGEGRGQVVVLALRDDERRERHQERPAQGSERAAPCGEEQPAEAGEPDRQVGGVHVEDLASHVVDRTERDVAPARADVPHELEKRPAVVDVPDHVRQEDQQGERPTEPDPRPREGAPLRAQQDADHEGEGEDGHRVLVLQAHAGEKAEPQPQPLVAGLDDADEDVRAPRPEQRLEGVHREEVVHHHVDEGQPARNR